MSTSSNPFKTDKAALTFALAIMALAATHDLKAEKPEDLAALFDGALNTGKTSRAELDKLIDGLKAAGFIVEFTNADDAALSLNELADGFKQQAEKLAARIKECDDLREQNAALQKHLAAALEASRINGGESPREPETPRTEPPSDEDIDAEMGRKD